MDLATRLDYFALGRRYVVQRAKQIDPAMVDVQGSDVNLVVGVGSVLADAVTKQLGYAVSALTLDGAYDEDLDRWVWDRYQQTRKGASAATGLGLLTRPTGAAGGGTVAAGTTVTAFSGVEYITTQPANFSGSALAALRPVPVRAVQAGKSTQVGANQIRRFKNPSALFDPTIAINNPAPTAGGEDRENDDLLKNRIRSFWNTQQRGTLPAIEFGAKTVAGVVSANAVESLTPAGLPARIVTLYIADSSGIASQPLADAVAVALQNYRAAGIAVIISTSIPTLVPIGLELSFLTGVDTVTLAGQVQAAVVEFVNSLPVNGPLYIAQLYTVLQRFAARGLVPSQSSIASPTGDVYPTIGQTIRTLPSLVTLA